MFEDEEDILYSQPEDDFSENAAKNDHEFDSPQERSRTSSLSKVERLKNIFSTGTSKPIPKSVASARKFAQVDAQQNESLPLPSRELVYTTLARSPFRSGDRPHLRLSDESLQSDQPGGKALNAQIANEEWRQMTQRIQQLTSIIEWKDKRIAKLENTIKGLQSAPKSIVEITFDGLLSSPQSKNQEVIEPRGEDMDPLAEYAENLIDDLIENSVYALEISSDCSSQNTATEDDESDNLREINQHLSLALQERTNQLADTRKDLWIVTIQYKDLEENLELVKNELCHANHKLKEIALDADNLEKNNQVLKDDNVALQKKFQAAQDDLSFRQSRPASGSHRGREDSSAIQPADWSGISGESEVRFLRFALEEANFCKNTLETEMIAKTDQLRKADYSVQVLRSLMAHADHQRKFLENSLESQTANLVTLRNQVEQGVLCQRSLEKELADKSDRWHRAENEICNQVSELEQTKIELDNSHLALHAAQAELRANQSQLAETEEQLKTSTSEAAWLRSTGDSFKIILDDLEIQLSVKNTEIQHAQDELAALRFDIQQTRSQKQCLEKELSSITCELDNLTEKYQCLQRDLATSEDRRVELETKVKTASEKVEHFESECSRLRTVQTKLESDKHALEEDLTATFEQSRQINHEKVFLRSQLDLTRTINGELEEKLEKLKTDQTRAQDEIETSFKSRTKQLEEELSSHLEASSKLQREVTETLESEQQLKDSLAERLADLADAELAINRLQTELAEAAQSRHWLTANYNREQQELEQLKSKNSTLEEQKASLDSEITDFEERRKKWDAQFVSSQLAIDKLEGEKTELHNELSITHGRYQALTMMAAKREEDMEAADSFVGELQQQLERSTEDLEAQLRKREAELHQAQNDIAFFRSKISDLEAEKIALEERLDSMTDEMNDNFSQREASATENKRLLDCLENVTTRAETLETEKDKAKDMRKAMEKEILQVNLQLEKLNAILENAVATDIPRLPESNQPESSPPSKNSINSPTELHHFSAGYSSPQTANLSSENGDDKLTLFNAIAESKSLLQKQLQEKKRECELAQAEIAALRSDNSNLEIRHSDFTAAIAAKHEALVAAAVDLASVRESLREDLQEVRESSHRAAAGQTKLLADIRHDLSSLSTALLKRDSAPGPDRERSFNVMMKKLNDFTNLSVRKISDEAEKNAYQFSQLLKRSVKLMDMIVAKLKDMDESAIAHGMLSTGAACYSQMTEELKRVLRQLEKSQSISPAAHDVLNVDMKEHSKQLRQILALIKPSSRSQQEHQADPRTKCPVRGHNRRTMFFSPSGSPPLDASTRDETLDGLRRQMARIEEELHSWRSLAIGQRLDQTAVDLDWPRRRRRSAKSLNLAVDDGAGHCRGRDQEKCTCPLGRKTSP